MNHIPVQGKLNGADIGFVRSWDPEKSRRKGWYRGIERCSFVFNHLFNLEASSTESIELGKSASEALILRMLLAL